MTNAEKIQRFYLCDAIVAILASKGADTGHKFVRSLRSYGNQALQKRNGAKSRIVRIATVLFYKEILFKEPGVEIAYESI